MRGRRPLTRRRVLFLLVYWIAVLALSIAILVGLILLIESRDKSSVGGVLVPPRAARLGLLGDLARENDDPVRRAVERVAGG